MFSQAFLGRKHFVDAAFIHQRHDRLFVGPVEFVYPDLSFQEKAEIPIGIPARVQELSGGVVSPGYGDARLLRPPHHENRLVFMGP
jgi:hypothetical protein